jgi:glycogen debranching enzyme
MRAGLEAGRAGSLIRLHLRAGEVQLSRGRTALVTQPTGTVVDNPQHGLFVYETRLLGRYRWLMNGSEPEFSAGSNIEQHSWMGYYIQAPQNWKEAPAPEDNPLQQTIELRLKRSVGEGMHEEVQLTNYTQIATTVHLQLELKPQFLSRKEAAGKREQHGKLSSGWKEVGPGVWELQFHYEARHHYKHQGNAVEAQLRRGLTLRIEHADSAPSYSKPHRVGFQAEVAPHGNWRCCLSWLASVDGRQLPLSAPCRCNSVPEYDRERSSFVASATSFRVAHPSDLASVVQATVERSRLDLADLQLYDLSKNGEVPIAAGVPTYMGVFGRDLLAAAWQASLLGPELALGGLDVLSQHQASQVNDWRDAAPGKIVHEIHTDPLAVLNFTPKAAYFGSASGSFLYPLLLSEFWHWTGDLDIVRRYAETARRALQWADKYSLDHTGFYRYQTKSQQGMKNQGWKDSEDAIVYPDGSQVPTPIGTCEMQAFAYAAKFHFSEILWWLGERQEAERLYTEAEALKDRFNDHFWMENEGTFAMGIDKDGELIRSLASDPGHCLLSGITDQSRVARLANRMLMRDMFSGWGIRTLSADHPAYNPFSYHRGSVWPVETGGFVLGFARYGLHAEMNRLARALFEAAALFPDCRLPEVFGGHQRTDDAPFPGLYTKANCPQAWSASAVLNTVRAMLGLFPYAAANLLILDPYLPDWLPQIAVENLRVGKALVTIKFYRKSDGTTDYEIGELQGKLHVIKQPSPSSLTAGWAERVKDTLTSLLPGH